jgi:seryl-tRNA synthetase
LEAERKALQSRTEELQNQRNTLSKQIGQLKAKGEGRCWCDDPGSASKG